MRALVQRVTQARVAVDGTTIASIGAGLLVLVAVTHGDDAQRAAKLAGKVARLRIMRDGAALLDAHEPEALVVSQFTLYGDAKKGTRPNWMAAAAAEVAAPLVEAFGDCLEGLHIRVARGVFGADMQVVSINDGPVTLMLDV
jgi:D-tyrosyl-tRNA(Tyr) deacylase